MVFSSWPTENSSILHKKEAALLMGDAEQYANNHVVYEALPHLTSVFSS